MSICIKIQPNPLQSNSIAANLKWSQDSIYLTNTSLTGGSPQLNHFDTYYFVENLYYYRVNLLQSDLISEHHIVLSFLYAWLPGRYFNVVGDGRWRWYSCVALHFRLLLFSHIWESIYKHIGRHPFPVIVLVRWRFEFKSIISSVVYA